MNSEEQENRNAFGSFSEILREIDTHMGYFSRRIDEIHTQIRRQDLTPVHDQPITMFKQSMAKFYNDFYFGNIETALKCFEEARRYKNLLGTNNELVLQSFQFNDLMMQWIKGKISGTHLVENTSKDLSIQILAHTNDHKNLHQTIKLLQMIPDAKFITYFDHAFNRIAEHHLFHDYNRKITFMNSPDKSNISGVFISSTAELCITANFVWGISIFSLEGALLGAIPIKGITSSAASKADPSKAGSRQSVIVIFGTREGAVSGIPVDNHGGKYDEKSIKRLFQHEGFVKLVAISEDGKTGMSFSYVDKKLVIYDTESFTVSSETVQEKNISSFSFSNNGGRYMTSYENSTSCYFTDIYAPALRKTLELKGHNNFVSIVRISNDGFSGLSCDLSNKVLLWGFKQGAKIIQQIPLLNIGHVLDIQPTAFFRFFAVKTTSKIVVYEPKYFFSLTQVELDLVRVQVRFDEFSSRSRAF